MMFVPVLISQPIVPVVTIVVAATGAATIAATIAAKITSGKQKEGKKMLFVPALIAVWASSTTVTAANVAATVVASAVASRVIDKKPRIPIVYHRKEGGR